MQYEQTFNAIDNILRNEAGCSTELDYLEQTSWLLFLKYLDDLENERDMKAMLSGKQYKPIITGYMRWSQWAAPKTKEGKIDDVNAMTGPDLAKFVDEKLFPYLRDFQKTASSANTLEYKIGEIFAELRNKITSGYNLREIINKVDELHFQSAEDKHEMTVLYESKIAKMGNAGRNGGEYYTPRPLIRTIVKVVDPQIGETVYDPACGSAGFLCEAFNYMKEKVHGTQDSKTLQEDTFYGVEKKPLPYIIATMNMIFHGVAAPNIIRGNTLAINLSQIQESDRKKVILANPPFGGSERGEVKQNFDINTSETAYMFMQHFIKMLKTGGRAGIVIKNTFLSNGDASALRKLLLEQCNLHTILDLPSGVFQGAGVKTVVLFFDKGKKTEKIWYYQLNPGRNLGKTNALNEEDLADFLKLQKTKADSENSWTIDCRDLGEDCDLSVKNPNKVKEKDERTPQEVFENLNNLQYQANDILEALQEEFWKDDIENVFGFVDENSDDYIVNYRLTKEERREYDELAEQGRKLEEMIDAASSGERDSLKKKMRSFYERMEDLINKYKDDDEYVDADYEALSEDNKRKIDALDEEIEALEKKLSEFRKPIADQINALLKKKEIIYKENRK